MKTIYYLSRVSLLKVPLWMLKTAVGVTHRHIRSSVRVVASAARGGA
jgi:hypothetical protein